MRQYRLEATPAVELDIEATFEWYEREEAGLGFQFLDEVRAGYVRVLDHPFGYQDLRSGIRRALRRYLSNKRRAGEQTRYDFCDRGFE